MGDAHYIFTKKGVGVPSKVSVSKYLRVLWPMFV